MSVLVTISSNLCSRWFRNETSFLGYPSCSTTCNHHWYVL
ncbi:hypothetical protein ACHAW5_006473, partial [Stephanodiscus triporus]